VYIFKSVQNLAYVFALNISTKFLVLPPKVVASPLNKYAPGERDGGWEGFAMVEVIEEQMGKKIW